MTPFDLWRAVAPNAVFDGASPDAAIQCFGSPEQERQAAADGQSLLAPLLHLSAIDIRGADARTFLQGQYTQDVSTLSIGQARFSAWCSPKGRMRANFILLMAAENHYHLILSADLLEFTIQNLSRFILRSDVRMTAAPQILLGLSGSPDLSGIALPESPKTALGVTTKDALRFIRLPDSRQILSLPPERLADLWLSLSARATPVGQPVWQWLDIRAGLPWITKATCEEFVPQMADFETLGVSFSKGCYVGQEVVARAQHLGKVKRRLYRLGSQTPMKPGDLLFSPDCPDQPDQTAGKVVTAAPDPTGGHAALAVLLEQSAASLRQGSLDGSPVEAWRVYPPEA